PLVAPREQALVGAARGALPLGLGREAAARPLAVGVGVPPVDPDDRVRVAAEPRQLPRRGSVVLVLLLAVVAELVPLVLGQLGERLEELGVLVVRDLVLPDLIGVERHVVLRE